MAVRTSATKRASELLAAGLAARAKPCHIGRSKHRAVVEAMAQQGGSPNLIAEILKRDLGEPAATSTVDRHMRKTCLCYRMDYHASDADVRSARRKR